MYVVSGFFTFGFTWLCWIVNVLIIQLHNEGVYRRIDKLRKEQEAYAEWERLYGEAWRAQQGSTYGQ